MKSEQQTSSHAARHETISILMLLLCLQHTLASLELWQGMHIFQHLHAFSFPLTAFSLSTSEQLAVQPHSTASVLTSDSDRMLEGIYKRERKRAKKSLEKYS